MKRPRILLLLITLGLVILAVGIMLQNQKGEFCANMGDGTTRCADSVADFFYELSGKAMTFSPEDIHFDIAVQTYNAYLYANNTPSPRIATLPPSGFSHELRLLANRVEQTVNAMWRSDPQPDTPTPYPTGTIEHCTNMRDGSTRCFASPAEMIYALSEGQVTIVPDDLPGLEAFLTYNAFVVAHHTPPTPPPGTRAPTRVPPFMIGALTATAEHSN